MKKILVRFAEKIDIINMNNIPMQHTIELMKNKDQLQQKVVDFIKMQTCIWITSSMWTLIRYSPKNGKVTKARTKGY